MPTREEEESQSEFASYAFKVGLAEMLTGGVIVEVTSSEEAKIAEQGGAVAVTVSEMSSMDLTTGGIARMPHPETIQKVQEAVTIPIIAKCRIGHFAEAQILESLFVDFIDENETLTPADTEYRIDKHEFRIPFICGAVDLGTGLRRLSEGAAMLRTQGAVGTGNIAAAVMHLRAIRNGLKELRAMQRSELMAAAQRMGTPFDVVEGIAEMGKLPIPLIASGGIVTPADAALMIQLGAESVIVDGEIFRGEDPIKCIEAIVGAVTHFSDPEILTKVSLGHLKELKEESAEQFEKDDILVNRGW